MRSTRIYLDSSISPGETYTLPANASNHLVRVLRQKRDSIITIFNGSGGEYACTLLNENPKAAEILVNDFVDLDRESPVQITLIQGLSRSEHMDLTVQKATELGISEIIPATCERSINMKQDRARRKLERWHQIAVSACEQSGRNLLPRLHEVCRLDQALKRSNTAGIKIVLDPTAESGLKHIDQQPESICILSGPEGGLSDQELNISFDAGFNRIRFGPRILRTETAAPALVAVLQTIWGDMG